MTIKEWAEEYDRLVAAGGEWNWPEWIRIAAEDEPELARLIVGPFKPTPENFIKACRLADQMWQQHQTTFTPRLSLAEARNKTLAYSTEVDRKLRQEAVLEAMVNLMVDQEALLAGLVEQAKEAAANRPAEGLCPADQIGLPVVPDPKSPQPVPARAFRGLYKTRDGSVVDVNVFKSEQWLPEWDWDGHGNHVSNPQLDLMRKIREGEGQ